MPYALQRLEAIEGLIDALGRECASLRRDLRQSAERWPVLCVASAAMPCAPQEHESFDAFIDRQHQWHQVNSRKLAEVRSFRTWLTTQYACLTFLPFEAVAFLAIEVLPVLAESEDAVPPPCELSRDDAIGLDWRDRFAQWNATPPNLSLDAPIALMEGESESQFVQRAREHARTRIAAMRAHVEMYQPGAIEPRKNALATHAKWWAWRHVERWTIDRIVTHAGARGRSTVTEALKDFSRYAVAIPEAVRTR